MPSKPATKSSWVDQIQAQSKKDARTQPWKKTLGESYNKGKDGEDWIDLKQEYNERIGIPAKRTKDDIKKHRDCANQFPWYSSLVGTYRAIMAHDEEASLMYIQWDDLYNTEKPFQIFSPIPDDAADQRRANIHFVCGKPEKIIDARPDIDSYSLDTHGFAFRNYPTRFQRFDSAADVEDTYLPELEQKNRDMSKQVETCINAADKTRSFLPASQVHVDQAPSAVVSRAHLHLPDKAEHLLQGRVRVVNIWRPIADVVEDVPLALCDARTITLDDMLETDHVRKHYLGATMYAMAREKYRWYYLHRQRKDEVTLLKMFDSDPEVEGKCCPHASFRHSNVPENVIPRESIEVRALIFSEVPQE
ncbi:hypothetical protein NUU61_009902 [Penicillium alfredii]|uniref:Uncharacterized protein n=1 Tax=Penicillium alfredii TaxID=1506179 RepID=A0A9W9EGZ2_9EURO|nr:uncharacterized protein NUU61_009902 [Penicillium alfredii]KAJ5081638.1 hypothetical protein NUU61_009902 [Penicillium alfredii]